MTVLVKPVSLGLSRCAYFIDSIVCKKIHCPFVSSLVVGGTLVFVVHRIFTTWSPYYQSDDQQFLPDFLLNLINLLFIVRFPLSLKKALRLSSNIYVETLLFVLLNVVSVASLYSPYPFSSFMHLAFRGLLWVLIICPYVIFALNIAEYAATMKESTHEKPTELMDRQKDRILALIIDTNNSFLAIFMAQSFTAVNLDLPFYDKWLLPRIYRYAAYSLKFYLIYCFVLYEITMVVYEIHDIKSYAELYQPIQLGISKNTWQRIGNNAVPYFLIGTVTFAMCFDVVMAWLNYYYRVD